MMLWRTAMTPRKREGSNLERRERPRWCTSGVLAESKEPRLRVGAPCLPAFCRYFVRADERTRTADLTSLRVIIHGLQRFARACNSRISKPFSFLRLAGCCTVLRSRWYQSGINRGMAASRSCSLVARIRSTSGTARGTQVSSLPSTATHTGCPLWAVTPPKG